MRWIAALAVSLIVVLSVSAAAAAPEEQTQRRVVLPPGAKKVPGLRQAPDLPGESIPLRRAFPDHPVGPPPRGEEFQPGEAPAEQEQPTPSEDSASREQPQQSSVLGLCEDVDLTSTLFGVINVAAQDNGICSNADIDTYVSGGKTYVVQGGGELLAWTQTEVTDPASPVIRGQFCWLSESGCDPFTYTPDVKTFHQGADDYIVMGLERIFPPFGFCGVIIVNVNDPANPVVESQFFKGSGRPRDRWCDVHNVFVEKDPVTGDGLYVYVTADAPNDLRVLDISASGSVADPVEIGRYQAPTADSDNFVHDVTVINHGGTVGRRGYLAYWDSGLVILDAADVTPGTKPTPIVGPNVIDPPGFLTHHSFASGDGGLVFIQDEFLNAADDEPVQMWYVSDPTNPFYVDGLVLGTDVPVNPAHNLEIRDDIHPDRLYVGWYKLGLQAWDFDTRGFLGGGHAPRTAVQYHQVETEATDVQYDGAWGVRLEWIKDPSDPTQQTLYIFQSDRRYGLIVDCVDSDDDAVCDVAPADMLHDVAVTAVTPSSTSVTQGDSVTVSVDVVNHGDFNESAVDVRLWDDTAGTQIGTTQSTGALAAGGTATVNFTWNTVGGTTALGDHLLVGTATLVGDDHIADDSDSTTVTVNAPASGDTPGVSACVPASGNPGQRITVAVTGSNFQDGATADFGEKIMVQDISFVNSMRLDVRIKVHPKADPGPRDVTVTNPDGQSGFKIGCFTVS